jgi:ubiquinone/menaquinone biosynthesis C-methylase UbiE
MRYKKAVVIDLGCGEEERHISGTIPCDCNYSDCQYVAVGHMNQLPWKDEYADIILSSQAFRNFYDDVEELTVLLKEIHRVLKPGGVLIVFDSTEHFNWSTNTYEYPTNKDIQRLRETAMKNSPFGGDIGPDYAAYDAGTEDDYDAERSKLEYAVQLRKSW